MTKLAHDVCFRRLILMGLRFVASVLLLAGLSGCGAWRIARLNQADHRELTRFLEDLRERTPCPSGTDVLPLSRVVAGHFVDAQNLGWKSSVRAGPHLHAGDTLQVRGTLMPGAGVCTELLCGETNDGCCNGCGGDWGVADGALFLPLKGPSWGWGGHACMGEGPFVDVEVEGRLVRWHAPHGDDPFNGLALEPTKVCTLGAVSERKRPAAPERRLAYQRVLLPTGAEVVRTSGRVELRYSGFDEIVVEADRGTTVGVRTDVSVHGDELLYLSSTYGGFLMGDAPRVLEGLEHVGPGPSVRVRIVVFETNIPVEHEWMPERGLFIVLQERTYYMRVPPL